MNLANKLTVFRMILVLIMMIVPFLPINGYILEIPNNCIVLNTIFIIASITDKLDGHIARTKNQVTNFGKFLDPIADKILVIVAMIILVEMNKMPFWIPAIVVIREFVVSGYRLVAAEQSGKVIAANIWGKLKTVTQMIGIILIFIDKNAFGAIFDGNLTGLEFGFNLLTTVTLTISVIATIFSGYSYLKGSKELFKGSM